ncbi:hypothetical protein IWW50_002926 [Coemansia erecta]|nr:hypothetical protein IWW50_002926 [Coemansia erecta]
MSARFPAPNGNAAFAMPLVTTTAGFGVPLDKVDPGTPVYGHFAGDVTCCITNVNSKNKDMACTEAVRAYHAKQADQAGKKIEDYVNIEDGIKVEDDADVEDDANVEDGANVDNGPKVIKDVCTCMCSASGHDGIVAGAFGGCQQADAPGDGILVKLLDGRSLPCSPNQPLLVEREDSDDGEVTRHWINAEDLQPQSDAVVCVPSFPALDDSDIGSTWTLKTSNHVFRMDSAENARCAMAFARIVGMVNADGHVEPDRSRSSIFVGSQFDVSLVQRDVKLLCGKEANVIYRGDEKHGYVYRMRLPNSISRSINFLDGQTSGKWMCAIPAPQQK